MSPRFDLEHRTTRATSSCVALALALALPRVSSAQSVLVVPTDFPTIQSAIDAASDGDVVLIRGGTYDGPITIDRELTLIGDPRPSIHQPVDTSSYPPAAIELAGAGTGKVVLVNLEISGFAVGIYAYQSSAGIEGGGFQELHLVDCSVEGPRWIALTGVAFGSPALETDVPEILVERSSLRGADSANDGCYGNGPAGPAGIHAPGSSVVVLDSTVRGGGSEPICSIGIDCPIGGAGGPGIVADSLWEAASDIQGGTGATHLVFGEQCGSAPDGADAQVVEHTVLGGNLTEASPPRLGRTWTLTWNTPGPSSAIVLGDRPRLTPLQTPSGELFLSEIFLRQSFPAGSASLDLPVPLQVRHLGQEIVAQVRGADGWIRPLVEVVRLPGPERVRRSDPP